jgi:hypothetical protein
MTHSRKVDDCLSLSVRLQRNSRLLPVVQHRNCCQEAAIGGYIRIHTDAIAATSTTPGEILTDSICDAFHRQRLQLPLELQAEDDCFQDSLASLPSYCRPSCVYCEYQ